jgi:glucose-1-phosphate cytidylyltransferase
MKAVILAGGFGLRISEESCSKPKPMIEIGGMPILWHIMKLYSYYGFNEFIICAGNRQHIIKKWFADYYLYNCDVTFNYANADPYEHIHANSSEPWKVTVVDTGYDTETGGRLKQIEKYIGDEPFFLTYGDGLSDLDILAALAFHKEHGRLATLTAVQKKEQYGVLSLSGNQVYSFREKMQEDSKWINGGFMILEPGVLGYIKDDETDFEKEVLPALAAEGQLMCYRHEGFWHCMDNMHDKACLESLIRTGEAPWMLWKPDRQMPGKERQDE